jgi:hypothetical protein
MPDATCRICGRTPRPPGRLRGTRCMACYAYLRRNGKDRPAGTPVVKRPPPQPVAQERMCSGCDQWKPRSDFHRTTFHRPEALCANCREIRRQQALVAIENAGNQPTAIAKRDRLFAERLIRYNLTYERYEQMFQTQNGRCAICLQPRPLVIDHDHATGRVRGLLCSACNTGIGQLGDAAERVRAAAEYLAGG